MPLHLIKVAVGIESIEQLAAVQLRRRKTNKKLFHITRHRPRRDLGGGSIYWIIKGTIRVRQRILGFADAVSAERGPVVRILLDAKLVPTRWAPRRAHQGWRYLTADKAPADLPRGAKPEKDPPPQMAAELRALGLI